MNLKMVMAQIAGVIDEAVPSPSSASLGSAVGRPIFQWGGTIFAIFLLRLNRTGRRSSVQSSLLVFYILTSFPTVLFKILRGQFGCWLAFLASAANLFFPQVFPVSRFLLFVITPDWLADGLRNSVVGGFFCLVIGVLIVIMEIRGIGGCRDREDDTPFFLCMIFLFIFTVLYLFLNLP